MLLLQLCLIGEKGLKLRKEVDEAHPRNEDQELSEVGDLVVVPEWSLDVKEYNSF